MGGLGSGKGTRRKAWRSKKKRYITSLPEIPVSKLIHAHRDGPSDNQFILGKLKCEIHSSSIHLKHDEKLPLDVSETKISAFPCYYGGYTSCSQSSA